MTILNGTSTVLQVNTAGSWTPTQTSGLIGWYETQGLATNTDNSYGTVDASGNITALKDLSGNGYDFAGAGADGGPALSSGAAVFNGTDEYLNNTTDHSNFKVANGTIGIVAKVETGVNNLVFTIADNGGNNNFFYFGQNSNDDYRAYRKDSSVELDQTAAFTATSGNFSAYAYLNGASNTAIYEDTSSLSITTANASNDMTASIFNSDAAVIGALLRGSAAYYPVEFKALIMYDSELTGADLTSFLNYLVSLK